jgi:hypothetical protein
MGGRPFRLSLAFFAGILLLIFLAHRDARRGYFEDDDLDTLTWARLLPLQDLITNIPTLKYPPEHSRPIGFFYYDAIERRVGLEYQPYVVALDAIGILNLVLLWLLLRQLGLDATASAAGCAFFASHRALFDAWWKPMFIYDVVCTTFSLLAILLYARRRWILSLVCFWLAVRTKEIAIVLPAIFLWYELTCGERKWMRTLPFFLPAAVYGVNGLIYNLHQSSNYSVHASPAALWKSLSFYSSKLFHIRYAGFLLLAAPLAVRDRRIYFGLGAAVLALSIYLLLPGRLLEVYLYLPMVGVAIVVAVLAMHRPAAVVALVAVAWLTWNFALVRKQARFTLAEADDRRAFVMAVRAVSDSPVYFYDTIPASMHSWGVEGALRLYHPGIEAVHRLEDSNPPTDKPAELLNWDPQHRRLAAGAFHFAESAQVGTDEQTPPWQLVRGWLGVENGRRRIRGQASARLYRPPGAVEFTWEACAAQPASLRIFVDGEELPQIAFDRAGCVQRRAPVRPRANGIVGVDFLPSPETAPLSIGPFGFATAPAR